MGELQWRRLGRTDMRVRALGLGCAWFGADHHTDRDAIEGVRRAIELGINFLDTSAGYMHSERRLGLALAGGYREQVFLQTKVGTHPKRKQDYSAEAVRWSVANSLEQLGAGYLDAVLIHDPHDIAEPLAPGAALDELLKMKDEGLVRYVGLGCRQHEFHTRAIRTGKTDLMLTFLDYTLLDQSAAETIIPLAEREGVGVELGSVLSIGRRRGAGYENGGRVERMRAWCAERGVDPRTLAIQFALALPVHGLVLVGPGTRAHVEDCYAAATADLDPEVWQAFEREFGVAPQTGAPAPAAEKTLPRS